MRVGPKSCSSLSVPLTGRMAWEEERDFGKEDSGIEHGCSPFISYMTWASCLTSLT